MTSRQVDAFDKKFVKRMQSSQVERDKMRQVLSDGEAAIKMDWPRLAELNDEDRDFLISYAGFVARAKAISESVESEL